MEKQTKPKMTAPTNQMNRKVTTSKTENFCTLCYFNQAPEKKSVVPSPLSSDKALQGA